MKSNWNWIDFASINKQITSRSYTGRTIETASALFPTGTHPKLVMIVIDPEIFKEESYLEAARDASDYYGPENMPAWWEGKAKTGCRFVGGVDPETNGPFIVMPNPSEMGIRFVEPALRDLGAHMNAPEFDMMLGFFINLYDHDIVDWVLQLASGSGGQVGQTFILTPEDIAAHGFLTRNPDLVPGFLLVGPYGTCTLDFESIYDGFDILLACYVEKGIIGEDEVDAAMQRLGNYLNDHDDKYDDDAYGALPSTDIWKDRIFPKRQEKAGLSIARKLWPLF